MLNVSYLCFFGCWELWKSLHSMGIPNHRFNGFYILNYQTEFYFLICLDFRKPI